MLLLTLLELHFHGRVPLGHEILKILTSADSRFVLFGLLDVVSLLRVDVELERFGHPL